MISLKIDRLSLATFRLKILPPRYFPWVELIFFEYWTKSPLFAFYVPEKRDFWFFLKFFLIFSEIFRFWKIGPIQIDFFFFLTPSFSFLKMKQCDKKSPHTHFLKCCSKSGLRVGTWKTSSDTPCNFNFLGPFLSKMWF